MEGAMMVVTPLYAALLALWLLVLSVRVIQQRRAARVSLGAGGNVTLERAIRGQANFIEYVPIALLMLLVLELARSSIYLLHLLGLALLLGRLLHGYAFAFTAHSRFGRSAGTALTYVVLVIEAALCLYQAWRGHIVWFAS
jgi:uncharacterized membrane protein YecN with MAPEG domain